jgi:hypothetical protein
VHHSTEDIQKATLPKVLLKHHCSHQPFGLSSTLPIIGTALDESNSKFDICLAKKATRICPNTK